MTQSAKKLYMSARTYSDGFAVSNIVKQRKSKFLHKFISLKKGADLYGQFVSVVVRELAAFWY